MFNKVLIAALGMLCLAVAVKATEEGEALNHEVHAEQGNLFSGAEEQHAAHPEAAHADPSDILPAGQVAGAVEESAGNLENVAPLPVHRRIAHRLKKIGSTVGRKGLEAFQESRPMINDIGNDLKKSAGDVHQKVVSNQHVVKGVNIVKPHYDATRERSIGLRDVGIEKVKNLFNRRNHNNHNNYDNTNNNNINQGAQSTTEPSA